MDGGKLGCPLPFPLLEVEVDGPGSDPFEAPAPEFISGPILNRVWTGEVDVVR